jgi:bacteriophage HK97-gp10 putative tail-component
VPAEFEILDPGAPAREAGPMVAERAGQIADAARANTPVLSGAMAGGWTVEPGRAPGAYVITNPVRYAKYVEFGTRKMPARSPLGRAAAGAR